MNQKDKQIEDFITQELKAVEEDHKTAEKLIKKIKKFKNLKLFEKLSVARLEANLTQTEVSRMIGIPQTKISLIEKGKRKVEASKELPIFAKIYRKPISWFYDDIESELLIDTVFVNIFTKKFDKFISKKFTPILKKLGINRRKLNLIDTLLDSYFPEIEIEEERKKAIENYMTKVFIAYMEEHYLNEFEGK